MVDGYALAGGCGIASACDFIVTTDKAQFGYRSKNRIHPGDSNDIF